MLNSLNKKYIISLLMMGFISSPILAGCGSCKVDNKADVSTKSSSLVTVVPKSGKIEGFVIASCGICNFGYKKSRGCSLTVKIGDTIYPVEGTSIHDHGDAHSSEGMCSAVRVAYASGEIKKNKFYSESFTLIKSPE